MRYKNGSEDVSRKLQVEISGREEAVAQVAALNRKIKMLESRAEFEEVRGETEIEIINLCRLPDF